MQQQVKSFWSAQSSCLANDINEWLGKNPNVIVEQIIPVEHAKRILVLYSIVPDELLREVKRDS